MGDAAEVQRAFEEELMRENPFEVPPSMRQCVPVPDDPITYGEARSQSRVDEPGTFMYVWEVPCCEVGADSGVGERTDFACWEVAEFYVRWDKTGRGLWFCRTHFEDVEEHVLQEAVDYSWKDMPEPDPEGG
jgi:hypothetical protein